MKNTRNLFGIIALAAVIALAMAGCKTDDDPCAHSWGSWAQKTAATCTAAEVEERACALCGEKQTQAGEAALGHLSNSWNWTTYIASTGKVKCTRDANCAGGFAVIGDTGPAGGKIFYVAPTGFPVDGYSGTTGSFAIYTAHYLEVAAADEGSNIKWSDDLGTAIPNVTTFTSNSDAEASFIGNGRKDTRIINDYLFGKESGTAAQVCVAKTTGSYNDWFLPSLGELNLMYIAKDTHGVTGLPGNVWIWSSSQRGAGSAWNQRFDNGNRFFFNKDDGYNVRAIRAF